ncbi:hypothetical protein [Nonomuraea sp. NPDC049141]|uniref:SbtR family transcriptional regulator n=1 Tax=Nonomuraea sp. NPDC049141 TaxID=3155500 RepID=UPI0034064795
MGTWVRAVTEHAATYSGLAAMLAGGLDDEASELHASCLRMADIGERLITLTLDGLVRSQLDAVLRTHREPHFPL